MVNAFVYFSECATTDQFSDFNIVALNPVLVSTEYVLLVLKLILFYPDFWNKQNYGKPLLSIE